MNERCSLCNHGPALRGLFLFLLSYGALLGLGIGVLTALSILLGFCLSPT